MINRFIPFQVLAVLLLFGLTNSCVSSKKYKESQQAAALQQDSLNQALAQRLAINDSLRLTLAHQRGVNEALYITHDKLQDRLDVLQLEIDDLTANASSTVQNLRSRIDDKDRSLAERQARLDAVADILTQRQKRLTEIETSLRVWSDSLATEACSYRQNGGRLAMAIGEDVLFRTGSTSRLESDGETLLDAVAAIVLRFPEMKVTVVGHTDNQPVNRQSLDNWQYSALRAVSVVKYLTEMTDLGANRILAAAKSEFEPMESNETKEGRARNRRIELVFAPDEALFIRQLEQAIK